MADQQSSRERPAAGAGRGAPPPASECNLERLSALMDGALPAKEAEQVRRHLAVCDGCGEQLGEWLLLDGHFALARQRRARRRLLDALAMLVMAALLVALAVAGVVGGWMSWPM